MDEQLCWSSQDDRSSGKTTKGGKEFHLLVNSSKIRSIMVSMAPAEFLDGRKVHKGEEFKYVLEGEMVFVVGEKTFRLKEGEWLWHNSELPHTARNEGNVPAKYLTVVSRKARKK